jgi:Wiskott-Aldrich syndrome protein
MPASTTLSPDDKLKVKTAVPKKTNKIITACVARIYHAPPGADEWTYAEQTGALVFCADKGKGREGLWFRMVDLTVGTTFWD